MEQIIHFLYNNQEIISRVSSESEEEYILYKPRVLHAVMVGPGEASVSMAPWFIGNPDGYIIVKKSDIGPTSESISKQLEDGYLQNTSSIQLIK